jgi:hypothetical protein
MKFRHAAALALAGWYLITPPVQCDQGRCAVESETPTWQWHRSQVMTDEKSCELFWVSVGAAVVDEMKDHQVRDAYQKALNAGVCVSESDPRLKQK